MDPAIISALVLAGATLTGAVIQTYRVSLKKQRDIQDDASLESASNVAKEVPYRIRLHEVLVEFNDQGDGVSTRTFRGVTAKQLLTDYEMPVGVGVSAPTGTLLAPELVANGPPSYALVLNTNEFDGKRFRGSIRICGYFDPDRPVEEIIFRYGFTHGLCTTRAEVLQAYAADRWTMEAVTTEIRQETDLYVLTIHFPSSYKTQKDKMGSPQVVAFHASTETMHEKERQRIRQSLKWMDNIATLKVDRPRAGIQYGIGWMPPV